MGILNLLDNLDVVQLDVEVLVDALERAADLDVVLELDRHLAVDERLEEAARTAHEPDGALVNRRDHTRQEERQGGGGAAGLGNGQCAESQASR